MKINRELQQLILTALSEHYPATMDENQLPEYDTEDFRPTLHYLLEHQLIDGVDRELINVRPEFLDLRITVRGLDYLQDDGGITAKLNTVTVRFDAAELQALLSEKISKADLPEPERESLTHAIRSLPAEGLRQVTLRLLGDAVEQWPSALRLLQTCVAQYM